ncbi:rab GTPase-binding effector protein 1 isoform X2 [Sitodiplosis mosellana]|uniref:rab GTPase-binding effector protein 1 isoform X2 n=1 Tax=Sitodiplosis mosellana TaxID=263140 RepID=UPI00244406E6|nr:rab GTPase-binding effector protein 1 isoform X2 [Sitodiplosis mosellana]
MDTAQTQDGINLIELQKKLATVEADNKTIREEFNVQRAQFKDLFLQKEAECKRLSEQLDDLRKELNETKSQVVVAEYKRETDIQNQDRKAQEEISSLQHLVHETVEESSFLKSEIDRLAVENERLRAELIHSQPSHSPQPHESQSSTPSFAPVLSQVKKTLKYVKLGGDSSATNENLEDSMRKAQEDAEVLRSLVIPLEGEINALKEKLRTADEEIQKLRSADGISNAGEINHSSALVGMLNESKSNQNHETADATVTLETTEESQNAHDCQLCKNYESQLVTVQAEKDTLRKDIDRYNEELAKEAALRHDLENKWQEKREKYNEQVQQLTKKVDYNEKEMAALQRHYTAFKEEVNEEFSKMANEREMIHRHQTTLQDDNDFLAGRYMASSEEMQNQLIDLPNTVEELQEILLQSHQSLIEARVGCEFAQRKCNSFSDEAQVLRDQLQTAWAERQASDRDFTARIKSLDTHLKAQESERLKLLNLKDLYEKKEIEWNKQSSELRGQLIELNESNEKLERQNMEFKNKISVLQQELGNSEAVQKDFVRLSQSLQMELEKIRAADTQVRWQDDEDVDDCRSCKANFTVTRRKHHCRHCGSIYCEKCLTKTVASGRNNKPARVCDVCHTLLVRNTAPYFSQAPPQSPH